MTKEEILKFLSEVSEEELDSLIKNANQQTDDRKQPLKVINTKGLDVPDIEQKAQKINENYQGRVSSRPPAHIVTRKCYRCGREEQVVRGSVLDKKDFACNRCGI